MTVSRTSGKSDKIKVWYGSGFDKTKTGRIRLAPLAGRELHVVKSREDAELVALTPRHYDELIERAENAAAVAAYRRTRKEEAFPAELLDQMLAGETPLRVWRRHRGMTQQELANKIGISKSHLSEVESGKSEFSQSTLRKAAKAMDIDPVSIFVLDGKD